MRDPSSHRHRLSDAGGAAALFGYGVSLDAEARAHGHRGRRTRTPDTRRPVQRLFRDDRAISIRSAICRHHAERPCRPFETIRVDGGSSGCRGLRRKRFTNRRRAPVQRGVERGGRQHSPADHGLHRRGLGQMARGTGPVRRGHEPGPMPVASGASSGSGSTAEVRSRNFLVPGLIAVIMTLIGALLTAMVMAREWERGTMEALHGHSGDRAGDHPGQAHPLLRPGHGGHGALGGYGPLGLRGAPARLVLGAHRLLGSSSCWWPWAWGC